jgi:prepilin-type processing-associated H-X9-DG protein
MLLPALSKAREKGRQAACISNLKQISLAGLMYADDNSECMSVAMILNAGSPGHVYANRRYPQEILKPYLNSKAVFICPSDASPWRFTPGAGGAATPPMETSYGYNINPLEGESSPGLEVLGMCGRKMAIIREPSAKVFWTDSNSVVSSGVTHVPWTGDSNGFGDDVDKAGYYTHGNGVSVAWCDGHVSREHCGRPVAPWSSFVTNLKKWQVNND